MIGRIYGIKDKRDGRIVYVGCTVTELWIRWCAHLMSCRRKTIHRLTLQIHKYLKSNGPLNFEPVVLEECEIDVLKPRNIKLRECEQKWMDKYTNLQNKICAVRSAAPRTRRKTRCEVCDTWVFRIPQHRKTETHKRNLKLKLTADDV